jgi:hypothetical protein
VRFTFATDAELEGWKPEMTTDAVNSAQLQSLALKLQARTRELIHDRLKTVDLSLSLHADAQGLLQDTARKLHTSRSRLVSIVVDASQDLLRLTVSKKFRDFATTPGSAQLNQPPSDREAEILALTLLARFQVRPPKSIGMDPPRCHLLIPRETSHLLRMVAADNNLPVTRIVETLLLLSLPDPNLGSEHRLRP